MSKNASIDTKALISAARKVRRNAHAPYSKFRVGAALLSEKGQIFIGANVENASYPEGICAEGAAIAAMVAAGHKSIKAIAIAAEPSVPPCGGCRQKITEFAAGDSLIILVGAVGKSSQSDTIANLLPHAFHSTRIKSSA